MLILFTVHFVHRIEPSLLLKRAQELDYVTTLVFGMMDSVGRPLADEFVETDIYDVDKIVAECQKRKVDGVIASSERTTEVTAIIAHRLGLPGNDVSRGFAARNKYIMRTRVAALKSILQPQFVLLDPPDSEFLTHRCQEAVANHSLSNIQCSMLNNLKYPVVVKALDSCAKYGIKIANNDEEMADAVAYAKKYSTDGRVLVEEYIEGGMEYSVECLAGNGLHEVIQITEYENYGPPHFVETAHHQPAELSAELRKRMVNSVIDVLKVLGINCGMAHMELKVVRREIYFIEVGARSAGGHLADILLPASTDFDYFKAAIDCCLGQYVHQDVHNVAYSGIFFRCSKNLPMKPFFEKAKAGAEWCISYMANTEGYPYANTGFDCVGTGHFAYRADHKITLAEGKRLLLLGSGVWKDELRQIANDRGITLIFAGNRVSPLDDVCDEVYGVDSLDHEAMKHFITTHVTLGSVTY